MIVVTINENRTNDIQRSEEEDRQLKSTATTNTVPWQVTEQTILDLEYRRA